MEQPKIVVDVRDLGYFQDNLENVPEGRKVRVAYAYRVPPVGTVLTGNGAQISSSDAVDRYGKSEPVLYFLPEDHPLEAYGKELSELPQPPDGFELCSETLTKRKPEGATYLLCADQPPVWVEYHSDSPWDAPRLWARPIPPPKRKYLKVPLEGVSWVDLSAGPLNRQTVYRDGQAFGPLATVVEEDEPIETPF